MPLFAGTLATAGSTPSGKAAVVDMTGLTGRYDFVLLTDVEDADPSSSDEFMTKVKPKLEKQLGLTLERRRATIDVLTVDHIDKTPTAN